MILQIIQTETNEHTKILKERIRSPHTTINKASESHINTVNRPFFQVIRRIAFEPIAKAPIY